MPIVAVATFNCDLADVRTGVAAELSRVCDAGVVQRAADELMRDAVARTDDAVQQLADDVAKEFRQDISIPVDYSTKPPTRSKPGEFPRYDTGAFSRSVQAVVYRPGRDKVNGVVAVDTGYAKRLDAIRFYVAMTESKWVVRAETRLAIGLR